MLRVGFGAGARLMLGSWVLGGLALSSLVLGCEEKREVPAPHSAIPGIVQGDADDGPLVDEDEACETFRDALAERKDALGCDDLELASCPELIRPAGALACSRFTKGSLDECTDKIEGYAACGDFGLKRCLLAAVSEEKTPGCVPPGATTDGGSDAGESSTTDSEGSEPEDAGGASEETSATSAQSEAGAATDSDDTSDAGVDAEAPTSGDGDAASPQADAASEQSSDQTEPDSGSTEPQAMDASAAPADASLPAEARSAPLGDAAADAAL